MEFGKFGGQFVPDHILVAVKEVEEAYNFYKQDASFQKELNDLLNDYANRPSLLYFAKNMTEDLGGAKVYLKREDLNHTGAHKINNVLGQALLAKRMGKTKLIAETGAGQHGVATATAAALLKMDCEIHMGAVDIEKQALNVYRMRLLGAKVVSVEFGLKTLKEAVDSALMTWANELEHTFYLIGSAVGPHPYPLMVKDFQSVISKEIKVQILEKEGRLPDAVIACVGGGSNAIGAFAAFLDDREVELIGVEAAGRGINTKDHAATMTLGKPGVIHGMMTKVLLEEDGEISPVYSISAGLDYPGVGPEHAYLEEIKRATYVSATDIEAIDAFHYLSKMEGIIPAIESSHAVAEAMKRAKTMRKDQIIVINLSGRGDKDVKQVAKYQGFDLVD
ncbi:MAG: tryptophan synthase subunit beta [Tenericutes bacterium GWC2_34_14]|nr:MAG: tryptophan synthase subunit beta [Tenericutes bacterium GWC2_34_14]OHE34636.1 MAG: tryptophan synthase subunit beta [Tenericutes bacterium GWE2_34_108]OHE35992.1 MAG: tryptophan synthase subunit beta [Tenericutes bacterium GWF1_35_14]OHE39198.1 MAG: tryptophan synthase subunit beta [Tenericutes bacterium GWF2_35_184]OHE42925.1 MAG: tryptophan synthase subunit beta [Tenericutes bacterium RIFOXYA2_FULL_36_32]OHE46240.1 MAG: tryptophan synthase subunit beta [Tenericutes bacterium RIFOXYB2